MRVPNPDGTSPCTLPMCRNPYGPHGCRRSPSSTLSSTVCYRTSTRCAPSMLCLNVLPIRRFRSSPRSDWLFSAVSDVSLLIRYSVRTRTATSIRLVSKRKFKKPFINRISHLIVRTILPPWRNRCGHFLRTHPVSARSHSLLPRTTRHEFASSRQRCAYVLQSRSRGAEAHRAQWTSAEDQSTNCHHSIHVLQPRRHWIFPTR